MLTRRWKSGTEPQQRLGDENMTKAEFGATRESQRGPRRGRRLSCKNRWRSALLTCLSSILVDTAASGQDEGAAGYLESIETQGDIGGIDREVDDTATEAEALGDGASSGVPHARAARVEEIVVSARRRSELLEDTPISITAIGSDTLIETQITSFNEIADLVPNLTIDGGGRGGNRFNPIIRGVGATESGNPGVGTYIDGVFMPRSFQSLLNVADIQQIEVLRGPQGTLFGKNTIGGSINVTTVAPAEELQGSVWIRAGSFNEVLTRSTLNVPVIENLLYSRLSFSSRNSEGYAQNVRNGEYYSDRSDLWFLGKLRLTPTDDIEVNFNGSWYEGHSKGLGGNCVFVPEGAGTLVNFLEDVNPGFLAECQEFQSQPYRFQSAVHPVQNPTDYGVWGNATWNVPEVSFLDDLDVRVLGSWREQRNRRRVDADMTSFSQVELANIELGGLQGEPEKGRQYLVEGQVVGAALDHTLNFVAGIFAEWETRSSGTITRSLDAAIPTSTSIGFTDQDDWDWAIFTQATWDVVEWLSLTGGLRYTEEKRGVTSETVRPFADDIPSDSNSAIFTSWTPMGSLALVAPNDLLGGAPIDHLMGYFTYAQGFSSGGFNAVTGGGGASLRPFDPSTVDNYELGFKTVSFDNRLTLNAAFFYMDYDDIQVTQSVELPPGPGEDLPSFQRLIVNGGAARLRGIEVDMRAQPYEGWAILGSIGVLDSEFVGDFPDQSGLTGETINRQGESFTGVPDFTSYLGVQYSFPVEAGEEWRTGYLTPRLDWSYQGAQNNAQPEIPSGRRRGFNMLNARLSYDFLNDRAQVALWGKNLLNEAVFDGGGGTVRFFQYGVQYFRAPRTWGGELSYRF